MIEKAFKKHTDATRNVAAYLGTDFLLRVISFEVARDTERLARKTAREVAEHFCYNTV